MISRRRFFKLAAGTSLVGIGCASRNGIRIIKASTSSSETEPQVGAYRVFSREIERRIGDAASVEIYANNALGSEREVIEQTILGAVELACPSNAPLTTFVPELSVFELPFLFQSRDHFYRVLDGPIGQSFEEPLSEVGLKLLGYFEAGVRHVMTIERTVEGIEDLEGLKIRTMENPLHLRAFHTFGASPLPMAYGEVYTALEQGVIDGAEAANTNYHSKRFFEVAPHWAMIGWLHLVSPLVMSRRFFRTLTPSQRRAVEEAGRIAVEWERQEYQRQERAALDELEEAGVEITHPDRQPFRAAAERVWRQARDRVDGELIEAIVSAAEDR